MIRFFVKCEVYEPRNPKDCKEDRIWTVSTSPDGPGWETDCGCPGYGLTYAHAKFLADAANEKLDRDDASWPGGEIVN